MSQRTINPTLVAALIFTPAIICVLSEVPHADVLAIFITIIGLWLTEAVPLPVTGLLVPVLCVIYGAIPAAKAFDQFGSDILFLFLGCFLMGRSMEKYGFDKRLAYFLLGRFMIGSSFLSINLILGLTSFILSMWISNTSATAVLSAITLGILASLDLHLKDQATRNRVGVRLLLTCAFAASIGGLATPVGSPPNLIAIKLLAQNGINISFMEWMTIALPIAIMMFVALMIIFELLFPLRQLSFPGVKKQFRAQLKELGPMSGAEFQIAIIFLLTIALWVLPGILHSVFPEIAWIATANSRLSMSIVGLSGGLLTFFLPVRRHDGQDGIVPHLDWNETDRVEWGTLMLFGGGLTLGLLLEQSGTAKDLGGYLFSGGVTQPFLLGIGVGLVSIIMSEFASNTAAASILIPLIIGATLARGASSELGATIVLACTFAASFGFMLPVSTPPNAIVYGTGKVPAREMRRAGVFFDLLGALIIIGFLYLSL